MQEIFGGLVERLTEALPSVEKNTGLALDAIPRGLFAPLVAALVLQGGKNENRPFLVLLPDNRQAEDLTSELGFFLKNHNFLGKRGNKAPPVIYLPSFENIPYDYSSLSRDISVDRMRALVALHRLQKKAQGFVLVTPVGALVRRLPEPERIFGHSISLAIGQSLPPEKLAEKLLAIGYQRTSQVEAPGEFSLRGDILDIFSGDALHPIRIEYFDDEIERMAFFEVHSQRSLDRQSGGAKSIEIPPAVEFFLSQKETLELKNKLSNNSKKIPIWASSLMEEDTPSALNQSTHHGLQEIYPLVHPLATLEECFLVPPRQILLEPEEIYKQASRMAWEYERAFQERKESQLCLSPEELVYPYHEALEQGNTQERIFIFSRPRFSSRLPEDLQNTNFSINEDAAESHPALQESEKKKEAEAADGSASFSESEAETGDAFDPFFALESLSNPFGFQELSGLGNRIREVRERICELAREQKTVVITTPYESQLRRIAQIFQSERGLSVRLLFASKDQEIQRQPVSGKSPKAEVLLLESPMPSGFMDEAQGLVFLTDHEFFGRSYKRKRRFKRLSSAPIHSFLDLKEGDFIVHVNHGVGRFVKLEKVKAAGKERDFLILEYAGEDRLYVPLEQISLVQRYIAPTERPRLDSLGKQSFKKKRERVEKKIEEFAEELIRLYALRMSRKGFAFPPDTVWQEEFEADFPFEETPDQLLAIEAVKKDMEDSRPMDRLICGDVGFGKTEVAIRAAFKAALASRQVAFIAPTTILAMQHYRNLSRRFADYPISVDWISRFRSRSEIKEIKHRLRTGKLDVVIGTHALLSNDIYIKNLGLLIIDEEQRFGVQHKERIKKMRELVDVMALSATPIPRTLHMSMTGIRDLSVIQTPPSERRSVQTYVIEDNDTLITQAIRRELERGGQVFYLHNRVRTIDSIALRLQQLLPDISIDVLHGQMEEDEVEDKLLRFMEKRFDVLITTSIIENGIDMPNVNTLIVDRADAFGLAQLYQIRGRVGRSDRQAYAYFLYPPGRALTEDASKRLHTILEYQELGSGFKIAMRDLELRGAGNILGREQSGQIVEVGYEMYINLLDAAVKRLRGERLEEDLRCVINLRTDFYIPEDYIPDTRQRIALYKRLESARTENEIQDIEAEMKDRYGRLPASARTFLDLERIRALASLIGFEKVFERESGKVELVVEDRIRVELSHILACLQGIPELSLKPGSQKTLLWTAPSGRDTRQRLEMLASVLRKMAEPLLSKMADTENQADASRKGLGISG